jgi:hypothetical protein
MLGFDDPHSIIRIGVRECFVEVVNEGTGVNLLLRLKGEEQVDPSDVQASHSQFA